MAHIDTYRSADNLVLATITSDDTGYTVTRYDGLNEKSGMPLKAGEVGFIRLLDHARTIANRWIEDRC